jgi:pimeloyl-ACP methyl ester carboxylesterase
MDAGRLPPPPPLPPGLPQLPSDPRLPSWLACGSPDVPVDARARARATFGALIATLRQPAAGRQAFGDADLRYFSYDPDNPTGYDPAATRQPLAVSAAALARELRVWHQQEPRATFDLVGHSLGGVIAVLWAADFATTDELRYVHAIITLDSPLTGYPSSIFRIVEPYLVPLFGDTARQLFSGSQTLQRVALAPGRWQSGPDHVANAVYNVSNLRDLIVPAFIGTLSGADGTIEDFGAGPDTLNHGAVLRAPRALAAISAVLQAAGGPQLAA